MTKYDYSIQNDFPNHVVDTTRLDSEIRASAITVALSYISASSGTCSIWFKAELSEGEETILDGLVAAHTGEPLVEATPRLSQYNRLEVELYKSPGKGAIICSHNFCDPCSWYQGSIKVEDEILQPTGNGFVIFRANNKNWIDLYHGRITRENVYNENYQVVIKVNDVEKIEGQDYLVDYPNGEIIFSWRNPFVSDCAYNPLLPTPLNLGIGALSENDEVMATYHYANSSCFTIKPKSNQVIRINLTEVQHSQETLIATSMLFQPWMPNPSNPEQMIPIPDAYGGELAVYKGVQDFLNEGNGGVGTIKAFGGGMPILGITKRGIRHDISVYPFDYLKTKDLRGDMGVELRIWCLHDIPLDGEFGTVTSYCTIEDI